MIGDEIGNVLTLDPRFPKKILNKTRISNRSITKLSFNGTKQFGVLSKTNVAHILQPDGSGALEEVHKHSSPGMIYAMCWDELDRNTFFVVGEEKYAMKVSIASK